MKRKLTNVACIVLSLLVVVVAGAAASNVLPSATVLGAWSMPANIPALTIRAAAPLTPTGSGFSYQGSLNNGGSPANGDHDFQFSLYDSSSGGNLVGGPITRTNVAVANGIFSISLDFGLSPFDGSARYLEVAVRQSGGGSYSTLTPRQEITPTPYALFALKTQPYKNVVSVAQSGGQYTSIQAALDSITDASDTNRYLVWVGPGTYNERVAMKQYVDIEGSGEKTTRITFGGSPSANTGTVRGSDNAELRFVTVENTGGNSAAVAVHNSFASPSLLHMTAIGSGGSAEDYGVYNFNSAPNMEDLTASASGGSVQNYAVSNSSSSPNMTNVTAIAFGSTGSPYNVGVANGFTSSPRIAASNISASGTGLSYGVSTINTGASVTIDNSKVSGTTSSIYADAGSTVRVGASQLSGGPVVSFGTLTCSASYDGNSKKLGSLCTPDTNVIYVAPSGGDFTSIQAAINSTADASSINRYIIRLGPGVYTEQVIMRDWVDIEGAGEYATRITLAGIAGTGTVVGATNAELRNLTVVSTGGSSATAIHRSPNLSHVTAIASGASSNFGIFNFNNSPTMLNVTAIASGSTGSTLNRALVNELNSSPNITNLTATVSSSDGSADNTGVANFSGSAPRIVTGSISVSGPGTNRGITASSSGTTVIQNSVVSVPTGTTIDVSSGATIQVGASQLSGGSVHNLSTLTCAGVYDENFTFFASTCP